MSDLEHVAQIYNKIIKHPYLCKKQHSLRNISAEAFRSRYGNNLDFTQEWLLLTGKQGATFQCYLFQLQNTPVKFGSGCHRLLLYLPTQHAIVPMVVRNLTFLKRQILQFEDYLPPSRCCYVIRGWELYRIQPLLPLFHHPPTRTLYQTEMEHFFPKQFAPAINGEEEDMAQNYENTFPW